MTKRNFIKFYWDSVICKKTSYDVVELFALKNIKKIITKILFISLKLLNLEQLLDLSVIITVLILMFQSVTRLILKPKKLCFVGQIENLGVF